MRNASDTAWKIILDNHLKSFFEYCLPETNMLVDWVKRPVPLDKELEAIIKGNDIGKRLLDKLFKVYFKDGREQWVLVHIEVQGRPDENFAKRMFTYAYRAFDKYQKPIISCAILTDDCQNWRPDRYEIEVGGCYLGLRFLTVKLLDYQGKEADLEASNNIFASVILAQLKALEIKSKSDMQRKQAKFALSKRLYEKGFTKIQVVDLYQFIDWLIGLSAQFEIEYLDEIYALEERNKMTYISFAERRGIEKGIEKGIQQGKKKGEAEAMCKVAKRLLQAKISLAVIKKTTGLSAEEIKELEKKTKGKH